MLYFIHFYAAVMDFGYRLSSFRCVILEENVMKKVLFVVASMLLSTAAYADTVNIISLADFITPSNPGASSTISYAFTPSAPISFKVAGKTCTWVSSSSPYGSGGGAGCNYNITVNSAGALTNATSNENGCTGSGQPMIAACK